MMQQVLIIMQTILLKLPHRNSRRFDNDNNKPRDNVEELENLYKYAFAMYNNIYNNSNEENEYYFCRC